MIPQRNLRRFFLKALKQPIYALRVFKMRFQANLYYFLGDGKSSYPEAITLFLTHHCNLACRMCGQWGKEGATKKQDTQYLSTALTISELKSVIDDLAFFKPNITLFGGEPLLYCDCIEVIKYIKQKNMHCLMVTNGSLIDGVAEEIVDAGLDELNVSLDGNAQLHDQIRGMPGVFAKIMKGLRQIDYFKHKAKKKKPLLNLQCTITQDNYKYLEQLIEVARDMHADSLTFHHLIFIDQELLVQQEKYDNLLGCSSRDWEGFVFAPGIEPNVLYEKIKQIMSVKYRFSIDFYPNFSSQTLREYYTNPHYLLSDYSVRCLSPWMVAYVFPDGEVRPCLNCTYSFSNLKKERFFQIWNNQLAVRFRQLLKREKTFPVCIRCTELYRY